MNSYSRRGFLVRSAAAAGLVALSGPSQAAEGTVQPAPHMPAPKFVDSNGIRMAVYEQGEGVPIVFCHGFPELAFSWRHQLKALSAAGFRGIAPDQRGYGLTGGPEDPTQYTIQQLCDDLAGMLDALGIDKAVFCGHDWGGGVVWSMVRIHPERCLGIIGVNTPASRPPSLPPVPPSEPPLIVRSPNYYVNTFMEPDRAERVLEADVAKTMRVTLSRGGIWNVDEFKKLPEDSPERQLDFLKIVERGTSGEPFLPDDVMQYFIDTFSVTGFTGGLNWYRNAARSFAAMKDVKWNIDVPCLYVGAEHDVILRPSSADGMEDFIADFERRVILDCGHWTQQEKPDELNAILIDWLNRKVRT